MHNPSWLESVTYFGLIILTSKTKTKTGWTKINREISINTLMFMINFITAENLFHFSLTRYYVTVGSMFLKRKRYTFTSNFAAKARKYLTKDWFSNQERSIGSFRSWITGFVWEIVSFGHVTRIFAIFVRKKCHRNVFPFVFDFSSAISIFRIRVNRHPHKHRNFFWILIRDKSYPSRPKTFLNIISDGYKWIKTRRYSKNI